MADILSIDWTEFVVNNFSIKKTPCSDDFTGKFSKYLRKKEELYQFYWKFFENRREKNTSQLTFMRQALLWCQVKDISRKDNLCHVNMDANIYFLQVGSVLFYCPQ